MIRLCPNRIQRVKTVKIPEGAAEFYVDEHAGVGHVVDDHVLITGTAELLAEVPVVKVEAVFLVVRCAVEPFDEAGHVSVEVEAVESSFEVVDRFVDDLEVLLASSMLYNPISI